MERKYREDEVLARKDELIFIFSDNVDNGSFQKYSIFL